MLVYVFVCFLEFSGHFRKNPEISGQNIGDSKNFLGISIFLFCFSWFFVGLYCFALVFPVFWHLFEFCRFSRFSSLGRCRVRPPYRSLQFLCEARIRILSPDFLDWDSFTWRCFKIFVLGKYMGILGKYRKFLGKYRITQGILCIFLYFPINFLFLPRHFLYFPRTNL